MDRRGFLRALGAGIAAAVAAPIIKPKSFFSFYGAGEVWKPAPIVVPGRWVVVRTSLPSFASMAMHGGILPSHGTTKMVWVEEGKVYEMTTT